MKKEKWVHMGHVGHFICGSKCQFHLNTCVGKYIVSTVGELWPERSVREIHANMRDPKWHKDNNRLRGDEYDHAYMKKFGFEEIGCNRKYETMVFKAKKDKENKCCPYTVSDWSEVDMYGYNTAENAYKGHLEMCNKWSKK